MNLVATLLLFAGVAAPSRDWRDVEVGRPAWFTHRHSSGIDRPLSAAIRTERDWHRFWSELNARSGPWRPAPVIDFRQDMLLVAAMGQRPTGGFAIRIASVARAGLDLLVTAVRTSPGRRCDTTQALTQPVDIVIVPRSERNVRWRFRDEVTRC